ncbi:MAG: flotillin-like FloA family protein, partial [Fidelibacterota bacterium]
AAEQEFRATVQEMRAKVVEAEAEVPKAMAQAFREGNLGVMDYFQMQNIQADTGMRTSIAKPGKAPDRVSPEESGPEVGPTEPGE